MQHFHANLLLAELLLKLHVVCLLAPLEYRGLPIADRITFELSRADGSGHWNRALGEIVGELGAAASPGGSDVETWLLQNRDWLAQKRKRPDQLRIEEISEPLASFCGALVALGATVAATRARNPLDVFRLLIETRNKTTGHRAYGPEFWAEGVTAIASTVTWMIEASPLFQVDLGAPLVRGGDLLARQMRGPEPTETAIAPPILQKLPSEKQKRPFLTLGRHFIAPLGDLIYLDVANNLTYVVNGAWRESDSSAEFLCHSLEASRPEDGTVRRPLPNLAIRPTVLPPSETEGQSEFKTEPGTVLNNLPARADEYVQRPRLGRELRALIGEPAKRHIINVRGIGGIGKTSLVLEQCHDLVESADDCPYSAVVWVSARDIDLTTVGARPVRRGSESLHDVWRRFAILFGEAEVDAREFFEHTMREEEVLLILDNFETFDERASAYSYLDELVRPPAKVVLTSRHVFSRDYALEVEGMELEESAALLIRAARSANREPIMTPELINRIHARSQGHPYAMKLIAAQLTSSSAVTSQMTDVLRREDLLDALFRRSIDELDSVDEAIFIFLVLAEFPDGLPEHALRIVADLEEVDLNSALNELLLRSLIELIRDSTGLRYDMPAMAREFARNKLLRGHVLQAHVRDAAKFIKQWPALAHGLPYEAGQQIVRTLRDAFTERNLDSERYLVALRRLAEYDARVWVLYARSAKAVGLDSSTWEDAYKRAVEHFPDQADLLWEWSDATDSQELRLALKVQAVESDPTNLAVASQVANLLNYLYANDRARYSTMKWAGIMRPVINTLEDNIEALDGEALSRLAWLHLHAGRATDKARRVVERGLLVDRKNESLQKLAERLDIEVPSQPSVTQSIL